jgi:hypothetical protein
MGLMKRGDTWYFKKMINGQRFVVSTGFADRKSAERRASEIEHDIRAGILGWKNNIPSFAEWWAIYKKTYTPMKSARNRDESIVAHFLPHFGARPLDEIRKSDMIRYLTFRRAQTTGCPGHKKRRQISESWDRSPTRGNPRHRSGSGHQLARWHGPRGRQVQEGARYPDAAGRPGGACGTDRGRRSALEAEPATSAGSAGAGC